MEPEPKNFLEHFDFTRRVATNKTKITHKILNLQHFIQSRYGPTAMVWTPSPKREDCVIKLNFQTKLN